MRVGFWGAAAVVVLLAVALSAARLLLPVMSEYRAQVEKLATNYLGQPVTIGSLDAAWQGLSPVLALKDVVIHTPYLSGGRLAVNEVQVALDITASLLTHSWLTAGVRVIGTELEVHTDLRYGEQLIDLPTIVGWLTRQRSISLENIQLHWRDEGLFEAPLRLNNLSAQLQNSGAKHQLMIRSELPASLGETVTFAADLFGAGTAIDTWGGQLYLRTEGLELSAFRAAMTDTGVAADGAIDLELWTGLNTGNLEWGNGRLEWQQPLIRNTSADAQQVSADSLRSAFRWRKLQDTWRADIQDFELMRDGSSVWPASRMALDFSGSDPLHIQGEASLLVLDELNSILPLIPWVDDDSLAMLDRLQPQGLMRDAAFEFIYRPGEIPGFAMRSKIEDLALAANGGLPGVQGLSGILEGNLQAGELTLDSQQARLIFPKLFSHPLALDNLKGKLHWQRYQDMFRIDTQRLNAASGPLVVNSRWQMDWSYEQAAPWLDLQLAIDDLPLVAVPEYLPDGVMSPRAVDWLERSFLGGSANNIRVLLQGRLDEMPFDQDQGVFEARFDFEDVTLDYHPTWGKLDELDGYAVFNGRSMRVTGRNARILESPLKGVVASIEDLQKPVLTIDGTAGGTLAAMLDYVQSSPLQNNFGSLVDRLDSSGDAHLQLNLRVPLQSRLGSISLNGDVVFADNTLVLKDSGIGLDDIDGVMNFTIDTISIKKASARLLGRPVKLAVYKQGVEGHSQTVVDIQGRFGPTDYLPRENSIFSNYLEGRAPWQMLLEIQNQVTKNVPRVALKLASDLNGTRVSLPAPFSKSASESRKLAIRWLPDGNSQHPLQITYADVLHAQLLLDDDQLHLRRAGVTFGGEQARLPLVDGIHLSGQVALFDLGQWLPILTQAGKGEGGAQPAIDMEAGLFRYAGFEVADVRVHSKLADPWHFQIDGVNSQGWLRWLPAERALPSRLLMKFQHLYMHDAPEKSASGSESGKNLSPTALPELNIEVGKLHLDDRELGAIKLRSRRVREGTSFEELSLRSPAIVVEGSGAWLEQNNAQVSHFNASITGGELGELTKLLKTGNEVKGGKLSGDMMVSWPGGPMDFELIQVEADISLSAKDGRLLSVDEGAGKLLSLFSLNSLQRRLSLDFRDVVKEGFTFDTMKGTFVLMDGDAFTNDFTIEGTSVGIDIAGRTGLIAHDYDQLVTVTPEVTSTLPIAGAIAGGPVVGAAVFLADKLVGDKFNQLTKVQYQVTGSWDEPVYKRLSKKTANKQPREPATEDIDTD